MEEKANWYENTLDKITGLEEVYNQLFIELEFVPLTIKQIMPKCFFLRVFSNYIFCIILFACRSKTIARDDESNIFIDETTREALAIALTLIYGEGWDRRVNLSKPHHSYLH
jgi:hypothetical protein